MDYYSSQISKLIEELSRLPGIGAKSAGRLAFHIINMPKEQVEQLAATLVDARNNVRYCKQCCTLTDKELCPICASEERDHKTIMVVENSRDLAAYEKTGKYNGVYHVLHGAISPMLGIGPGAVSYTHLDVYKRQQPDSAIFAIKSLFLYLPLAITVVVLIIWYLFMGIDKVYPTVRKELDERRKNAKQN